MVLPAAADLPDSDELRGHRDDAGGGECAARYRCQQYLRCRHGFRWLPPGAAGRRTMTGWNAIDAIGSAKPGLREHLEQQARLAFSTRVELADRGGADCGAGRGRADGRIAGGDCGRAGRKPGAGRARANAKMMRFDPTGVFARNLAECLARSWPSRTGWTRRWQHCWKIWTCWRGGICAG
jgi:hypothetical protein